MPHRWIKRQMQLHDTARAPLSRFGMYGLITFLIVLIAVGSWVGAKSAGKGAAKSALVAVQRIASQQLAQSCGRNQTQRGYLLLRAREFTKGTAGQKSVTTDLAPHLFQIVWCERTFRTGYTGPTIFLPRAASQCFLKLEDTGYWNRHAPFTDPTRLLRLCANQRR